MEKERISILILQYIHIYCRSIYKLVLSINNKNHKTPFSSYKKGVREIYKRLILSLKSQLKVVKLYK